MGRSRSFARLRSLPLVGRMADWGMGPAAASRRTERAGARIAGLKATESICPYCAVGCGQVVYTRDGELVDIEGNPRSPINQGTLCPKGSASRQLVMQPGRLTKVKYRRPGGAEWEELELGTAMGATQIENQARIGHSSTVPGLGTTFGRGGATTFQQDLQHADCILIQGSSMAEAHPARDARRRLLRGPARS